MKSTTISSRSPEGDWASCPVCGKSVPMEPSFSFGDVPCPSCGSLLRFMRVDDIDPLVEEGDEFDLVELVELVMEGESDYKDG